MPYLGNSPANNVRGRFYYTATAAQTVFSGADSNGKTLAYQDGGYVDVYLNGVLLQDTTDYTATTKTSVTLTSGATAGDLVEIIAYGIFSVGDTVSAANGGTFKDNITIDGDLTVDTDTLYVDSTNNRVGIGTTSPVRDLQIGDNTGSAAVVSLQTTTTGNGSIYFGDNSATSAEYAGVLRYSHSDNTMQFWTSSSERARIDSSGNLLVGKTSSNGFTAGGELRPAGDNFFTRASGAPLQASRLNSDGDIAIFYKDSTEVGSIGTAGGDFYVGNGSKSLMWTNNNVFPRSGTGGLADNTVDFGNASNRFNDAYITNGVTTGSDANEKQQIAVLTDAEIAAAKRISAGFKTFKWNDAVEAKGDNARTHTGVIAQEVQAALEAEGLDAGNYAFWMSDTWWETQTEVPAVEAVDKVVDEDGNVITEAAEAKEAYTRTDTYDTLEEAPEGATERTRLGIRYPELLAFIGAATEQRLTSIEARLEALETA